MEGGTVFHVQEILPFTDNRDYQTARLANRVMPGFLTSIAMKRKGMDSNYIHPLVSNLPN